MTRRAAARHGDVEWVPVCSRCGTIMEGNYGVLGTDAAPKTTGSAHGAPLLCPSCGNVETVGPETAWETAEAARVWGDRGAEWEEGGEGRRGLSQARY